MRTFVKEIARHLEEDMIPFWENLKDTEYGGYYGYVDNQLKIDRTYEKGCILNSRILWFFSSAYKLFGKESLRRDAEQAYLFLKEHCQDEVYGGIYWSLTYDGKPKDSSKHTYNQAFAIYALAAYYDATGKEEALNLAFLIWQLIEEKCKDEGGYLEAFDRTFHPMDNEKLSENGVMAGRTMNTLLHLLEAYTELYRVSGNEMVGRQIRYMLDIFQQKVYNQEKGRQEVFFDDSWNSLIDLYSYGHDIETSWLVDRALLVLGDETYTERIEPITKEITKNIFERAFKKDSLPNEAENGVDDTTRVWWVQAEAVVGFINGYEKEPEKIFYLEAAESIWRYICQNIIDKRPGSEWLWAVDEEGRTLDKPIVEPWKCPYHNGRMCMEVIRRLSDDT